jgi:hypothetical protein
LRLNSDSSRSRLSVRIPLQRNLRAALGLAPVVRVERAADLAAEPGAEENAGRRCRELSGPVPDLRAEKTACCSPDDGATDLLRAAIRRAGRQDRQRSHKGENGSKFH